MGAADSPAELDDLPLGAAAEWYAARRLSVFPCRPRGKEPLVPGGFRAATADLAAIREWWRRWPAANIGIPTGRVTGWLVIDIDPRNGGDETIESWLARYGRWPPTAEAISGGGGRHVVFRYAGGLRCGALAPGVDLKADGGYVIVAPSVHPSGNRYSWDGLDGAEALDRLAEAPGWLLRLARERRRAEAETGAADRPPISEGARNDTLFRLAAALRAKGLGQAAITAALLAENAERCRPPLPEEEVRRIVQSAARYPAGAGRPVDVDAARTPSEALTLLNALPIWAGRLRWVEFRRVGGTLIGVTEDGEEARYEAARLVEFRHIAGRTLEQLGVALPPPKKGQFAAVAGTIGELMIRAAAEAAIDAGRPEDDLLALLRRCWAGNAAEARDNAELFRLLELLRAYRRQPHSDTPPPCVIRFGGEVLVHPGVFQAWASCPAGAAKYIPLPAIREALGLLGLRPSEFDLQRDGERQVVTLWRGPWALMEAD